MGSGQSARKLTISNEEEVGVIKVSNAIVERLAQKERTGVSESEQNVIPSTPTHPTSSAINAASPAAGGRSGYSVCYYPELTMSALQIQQQKEQELKQQDQYWQKRLKNLEESYQKINHILEDEYKKAVDETSVAIAGQRIADIQDTVQPCLENSNKVLKCYQDHPKETLKCANLVDEFSNCVWNVHYTSIIEARS